MPYRLHAVLYFESMKRRFLPVLTALIGLSCLLGWLSLATAATSTNAPPIAADSLWQAEGGILTLSPSPELLRALDLGLALDRDGSVRLALSGALHFLAPTGDFRSAVASSVSVPELAFSVGKRGFVLRGGRLLWSTDDRYRLTLSDPNEQVWLEMTHAHDRLLQGLDSLVFESMDLRIGPALARLIGDQRLAGQQLGGAQIVMTVTQRQRAAMRASSCEIPLWPAPPMRNADVRLVEIDAVQALRARNADGPGGSNGEIVVAPAASLLNVGTSDVPWYRKFVGPCAPGDNSGVCAPYGNDQHPFLLWSMYRMDQFGQLKQIARSGLKHAYLSVNSGCDCNRSQVLGIGCGDVYGAANNDTPFNSSCADPLNCHQGLRQELAPREGVWGRCGSVFDPNCDGNQSDYLNYGPYERRMVVREADIESPAHANATFFVDSWYVVRDDNNLENNMGAVQIRPEWVVPTGSSGIWVFGNNVGPFSNGSVLQRWVHAAPTPIRSAVVELSTPSGRVQIAVRVDRGTLLAYRYNYAVLNLDLTDTAFSGMPPNIRLLQAVGIRELRLGKSASSQALAFDFVDNDDNPDNDWLLNFVSNEISWTAPGTEHLRWGDLYGFSFEAVGEPIPGRGRITARAPDNALNQEFQIWNPGTPRIFRDGFEAP